MLASESVSGHSESSWVVLMSTASGEALSTMVASKSNLLTSCEKKNAMSVRKRGVTGDAKPIWLCLPKVTSRWAALQRALPTSERGFMTEMTNRVHDATAASQAVKVPVRSNSLSSLMRSENFFWEEELSFVNAPYEKARVVASAGAYLCDSGTKRRRSSFVGSAIEFNILGTSYGGKG